MSSSIIFSRFPRLARFWRREEGTVLTEFVIIFPILIWAWIGMFYYWDVYRAINLAQKASFTISDNLSRSNGTVDAAYLNGLETFLAYLANTDNGVQIRISSIGWNNTTSEHVLQWSYSPGNEMPVLTSGTLQDVADRIPTLAEFETVLLVETRLLYDPPLGITKIGNLDLGIGPRTFQEFIVTRPRFVSRICLDGTPCT